MILHALTVNAYLRELTSQSMLQCHVDIPLVDRV